MTMRWPWRRRETEQPPPAPPLHPLTPEQVEKVAAEVTKLLPSCRTVSGGDFTVEIRR